MRRKNHEPLDGITTWVGVGTVRVGWENELVAGALVASTINIGVSFCVVHIVVVSDVGETDEILVNSLEVECGESETAVGRRNVGVDWFANLAAVGGYD